MGKICCAYMIVNLLDYKHYVGSTVDFKIRVNSHKCDLRNNYHHSPYLQNAWNKYGEKNFVFILLSIATERTCRFIEAFFLSIFPCHYNSDTVNTSCNFTVSDDTRRKISDHARQSGYGERLTRQRLAKWAITGNPRKGKAGKKASMETRKKISEAASRRKLTDNHKAKIAAATTKRLKDSMWRRKMSEYATKRWSTCE